MLVVGSFGLFVARPLCMFDERAETNHEREGQQEDDDE